MGNVMVTTHKQRHSFYWLYRLVLGFLLILSTVLLAFVGFSPVSYASSIPGGNVADPIVRAVDIAKPAVVRIFTSVTGHLLVQLAAGTVSFPQSGTGYPLTFSGSGAFISAHGDILTADHVVNPPVQDPGIQQAFEDTAAPDVTTYLNQHGSNLTADQVDQELRSGQLSSNPHIDATNSYVFLSTDYTGPLTAPDLQSVPTGISVPVDKIEKESSFNQNDVAIIHVAMNDMASIPLGNAANVQQQDELTIIGFPGNGDVSTKPTDLLTSSVNKIIVSSIKTTDSGAPVIQVGGNVEHGDSGGPALDSGGQVVGIVSFGISSPGSTGSTSFLQSSSSALSLVQSLKLDTTPGAFQKAWSQAFNDYAATTPGHWHTATQELQRLASTYPLFKAITPYLNYAQTQAATEKATVMPLQTGQSSPGSTGSVQSLGSLTLIGVILLALALLIVVLLALVWRRSRNKKVNAAQAAQSLPMAQGPQTPPSIVPVGSYPSYVGTTNGGNEPAYRVPQGAPGAVDSSLAGMGAFGAPAGSSQVRPFQPIKQPQLQPQQGPSAQKPFSAPTIPGNGFGQDLSSSPSGLLRPWPCGHMNRSNARFCSVCGEPAPPPPPMRRVEQ